MATELKVPSFGESVSEAYMGDWLKSEGDLVRQDEPIVVIETDKVTAELPAPISGRITKVLKSKGDSADIGEVIGYMEAADVESSEGEKPSGAGAQASASGGGGTEHTAGRGDGAAAAGSKDGAAQKPAQADRDGSGKNGDRGKREGEGEGEGGHVMPAARRVLEEAGVDAKEVSGSGPGGRILKEDAERHVEARTAKAKAPAEDAVRGDGARETETVPMSRIRARIAERLVESQQSAALLTTFNEIDMTEVMKLRAEFKEQFTERHGIKLGFMSFFVKAAIEALKLIPAVNARIEGTDIIYHNYYDVGIAVGGGRGLVVPVIRNAERLSFAEVELKISDFAKRAKENTLELDELQGGTFTISNGGVYGSMMSTPIVNPPQSGILGLHAIQDRPVARDGEIVIRPMMYVALTYDHRLVDGRESVTFLKRIKECVESPSRILLEI